MGIEGFLIGIAIGAPILVGITAFLGAADVLFSRRVEPGGERYWVRGDAAFQSWLSNQTAQKVAYGKRMLLILRPEEFCLYMPHRVRPVLKSEYSAIIEINTETFRSRTVGGRGVRIRIRNAPSFTVRPERVWLPSVLAPRALTNTLASDIASRASGRADARAFGGE